MLRELLKTLGPQVADPQHPFGTGYTFHGGFELKCEGDPDPSPDNVGGRINRHVIGTFTGTPDDHYPVPHPDMPDSNPEVNDSVFALDPAQSALDPNNPVCCVCGAAVRLNL